MHILHIYAPIEYSFQNNPIAR